MNDQQGILCIGEVLWDSLPSGLFFGGAPLNVCYHLNQLGVSADIASRVGDDRLGKEALSRIEHREISTDYMQTDNELETGFVSVELSNNEDPQYDIIEPVAWDNIECSPKLESKVASSWGIVFGSLAQRSKVSRNTIQNLWETDAYKIFDVNLRPPFINQEVIHSSLRVADIVKMNHDELMILKKWYSIVGDSRQAVRDIALKFNCNTICITHGSEGAIMYRNNKWFEQEGFPVDAKDTVGAGDAFLAALLRGIRTKKEGKEMLAFANAAGSLIAQKDGATPSYSLDDVRSLMS